MSLPRWIARLVRAAARPDQVDEALGDADELYRRRAGRRGKVVATAFALVEALDLAVLRVWTAGVGFLNGKRWAMRGWTDDLTSAWRGLRRSPAFTFFAVSTLSLGIGATVSLIAVVDRALLRPLDFPEADRLVLVWSLETRGGNEIISPPDAALAEQVGASGVFDALGWIGQQDVVFSSGEAPRVLRARFIDQGLPRMAGLPPVLGRTFTEDELKGPGAPVVVLSEGLWKRAFGSDPGVLGKAVRVDGVPREIVGVAPEALRSPAPGADAADVWLPLAPDGPVRMPVLYARLAPNVSLEQARERVAGLSPAVSGDDPSDARLFVRPVVDMVAAPLRNPLRVVGAAVTLLFLIACLNIANLLLVRGDRTRRESAIRMAVGAGPHRLGRESLFESGLIASAASALGLGLAAGTIGLLHRLRPDALSLLDRVRLDPGVTALAVAAAVGVTVLFGAFPMFRRLRTHPADALAERAGTGSKDSVTLRRVLLVGEVAFSMALLAGAIQLSETLVREQRRDVGVAANQLLAIDLRLPAWSYPDAGARERALERTRSALAGLPGVSGVAVSIQAPPRLPGIRFGLLETDDASSADGGALDDVFLDNRVSLDYFRTLGQAIVRGRGFTAADRDVDPQPIVVSERFAARCFPHQDALGHRLRTDDTGWKRIVGVVRGVARDQGIDAPYPELYELRSLGMGTTLVVRTLDTRAVAASARSSVAAVEPGAVVTAVGIVADAYRHLLARERLIAWLLSAFAALAAVLAAVGLYGVVAQLAARRVREFWIRMALGAQPSSVLALTTRGAGATLLLGLAVGYVLAWGGMNLLEAGVVGLDAARPDAMALAAAALSVVTLVALWGPAVRAARTDAAEALRSE